jgi:hypothetical protein
VLPVLAGLGDWSKNDVFTVMAALNGLDALGPKAGPVSEAVASLPDKGPAPDPRYASYVPRLLEELRGRLTPAKAAGK